MRAPTAAGQAANASWSGEMASESLSLARALPARSIRTELNLSIHAVQLCLLRRCIVRIVKNRPPVRTMVAKRYIARWSQVSGASKLIRKIVLTARVAAMRQIHVYNMRVGLLL